MKAIRAAYEKARKEAERNLEIQAADLKKYAAIPNANPHSVKLKRQALDSLGMMIAEANAALNRMEAEAEKAIQAIREEVKVEREKLHRTVDEKLAEAYALGHDAATRQWYDRQAQNDKYAGLSKEGIRSLSKSEARSKWPELFE